MDSADFIKGLVGSARLPRYLLFGIILFRNLTVQVVSNIIFLLSFSFLVPEKDKNIDLYPRIIFLLVLLWPTQRSKNSSGDPQNGCAQGL